MLIPHKYEPIWQAFIAGSNKQNKVSYIWNRMKCSDITNLGYNSPVYWYK